MDNQPNQQPNIPQEPQQSQPSPQPTIQPETPQKQGLPTWAVIVIVIGTIIVLAGASYGVYWYFTSQPTEPLPTNQGGITLGQLPTTNQTGVIENIIEFDGCGKKDKYKNLSWWSDFIEQIERTNFYSENYIQNVIGNLTYEEFCEKGSRITICGDGINRKLEIDQFGEGCLSKDNSLFIAVFPGEYMDDGNHIFSYQIDKSLLEKAKKINEESSKIWRAPPQSFLGREDQIINMKGGVGDAGCWIRNDYQYNYITNEVKLIKRCEGCQQEEGTCELYD